MIQLQATEALDSIELGRLVEFHLVKDDPAIETRFFLRQSPIIYTRALKDWTNEPVLVVFPEAPGSYTLLAEWRAPDGRSGWEQLDFAVVATRQSSPEPQRVQLDEETAIWVPSAWEANVFRQTEKASIDLLATYIEPGSVVYDIGANVGVYAARMARLAGPEGRVVCVEANPLCVQFLRTNLMLTSTDNFDILPVAVLDRNGETRFALNYGNSNLGLSEVSHHYGVKAGHEIVVPCYRLDYLIEKFHLRPPAVIKMDIEGAEHRAILGMRKTLRTHRPVLMLEIHGKLCAANALDALDRLDYRYRDPKSGENFDHAAMICERFADRVFQLLALPV